MPEMRTYLQYKKMQGDPAMPASLSKLRERCLEVCGRCSPSAVPDNGDDKSKDPIIENEQMIVTAGLDL